MKGPGAIRWRGNSKTSDKDSGGQIGPGAEAAGYEVTGEIGGIDRLSLTTIDQQSALSVRGKH